MNCNVSVGCGIQKFFRFILRAFIAAAIGASAQAAIYSWSGAGGNGFWNNSGNWGFAGVPANGDTVIFPGGAAELTNTNNLVGLTLNQIRFVGSSGGYNIWGNGFTITNGILATNTIGANAIDLTNAVTIGLQDLNIVVSNSATLTIDCSLNGTHGLVKNGNGVLELAGPFSNTYGGTTTINAGTVEMDKNGVAGVAVAIPGNLIVGDGVDSATLENFINIDVSPSANVTINNNGLWDLNSFEDNIGTNLTLNGSGVVENGGPLLLAANATIAAFPGNSTPSVSGYLDVNGGVCTMYVNPDNGFLDIPAIISDAATINKTGGGGISFDGNNTFTGQLNVLGGTLYAFNSLALGSTNSGTTVSNTASIWVYFSITNEPLTIASTGNGLDNASGANIWIYSNITLAAQTTIPVNGASLELRGLLTGAGGFTKTGSGTLELSGNGENTYSGATIVNNGTLLLNQAIGHAIGGSSQIVIGNDIDAINADVIRYVNIGGFDNEIQTGIPIYIKSSGLLDLNGDEDDMGPIYMESGNITTGAGQVDLLQAPIVAQPTATFDAQINGNVLLESGGTDTIETDNALHINGTISGALSETLVKTGNADLYVSGNNTYFGQTLVQQGTFYAESSLAFGATNNGTVVSNGASVALGGNLAITNESLTLNGTGWSGFGALFSDIGLSNIWAGPVILNGPTNTIENYFAGTIRLIGPVSGPGALDEFGDPFGTVTLEGTTPNSYAGATVVDSGILLLDKSLGIAAIPGNTVVNSSGTLRLGNNAQTLNTSDVLVNSGGLFDFASYYAVIDTLRGTGNVTFGTDGYLYIGANNGSSEFDGVISGVGFPGGFTIYKEGAGTFTLTNNNTYSNATDIGGGTLVVNGDQHQSPVNILTSGQYLDGVGTVGNVSAFGVVSPGVTAGSTGILTSSNAAFSSTGAFTVDLHGATPGTDYDQLSVRGITAITNATLVVTPNFYQPVSINEQFVIITNNGVSPVIGQFSGLPEGSVIAAGSYFFRISYVGGAGNDVVLTLVGVPGDTVTLNAVYKGWWNSSGNSTPDNTNYICGKNIQLGDTNLYNNFFVFNAPVFSGSIVHAELILSCYANVSSNSDYSETYLLRGVTTPIPTLEAGGSGMVNIYNDLASNAVYGVRTVATNESYQFAIIPLNVKFLDDITAASGGQIALGGSVVTLDANTNNQMLYGFSGFNANDVRLRLTFGTATTLSAVASGWYDDTGFHNGGNENYFAGASGATDYRDFFVYNLPVISGPLVNAQLLVNGFGMTSPSGKNTYQLFDVTTPISTLTNTASGAVGTYTDLGSGTFYGGRDVFVSESYLPVGLPLNTAFVSDVHVHSGGAIALGGEVSSLTPASTTEWLFGSSSNPTNAQLFLGYLNAPAVTPTFGKTTNVGNNEIRLSLSGGGASNEIQGSIDLTNWDYIGDLPMTNTPSAFIYTNNPVFPYRFFRARIMP